MTVARLADGTLWVHSPIAPDKDLLSAIDGLGPVAWLIAPNSLHCRHIADWQAIYPGANARGARSRHAREAALRDRRNARRRGGAARRAGDGFRSRHALVNEAVFSTGPRAPSC